jgi:hypothetical protein
MAIVGLAAIVAFTIVGLVVDGSWSRPGAIEATLQEIARDVQSNNCQPCCNTSRREIRS